MGGRFAENPAYTEYETLLKQLHMLIAKGRGDDTEADAIRDAMDGPERRLSLAETIRLNGLSADLYMLHGAEVVQPLDGKPLDIATLQAELVEAQPWNDWDSVLRLLRRRDTALPDEVVAAIRARAYDALGHSDTAILFLDFAFKNNADDPGYRALRLLLLETAGRSEEAVQAAEHNLSGTPTSPLLQIVSTQILFTAGWMRHELFPGPDDATRLLRGLDRAVRLPSTTQGLPTDVLVLAQLLRAACFEGMGRIDEALRACEQAKRLNPQDQGLQRFVERLKLHATGSTRDGALRMLLTQARGAVRDDLWKQPIAA